MAVRMIQVLILPGTIFYDDLCLLCQLVRWPCEKGHTSASNGLGCCIYLGSQGCVMDSSGSTQQVPLYFSGRKVTSHLLVLLCLALSPFSYLHCLISSI